eukprot:365983-Chlamydomonas_euryale.AAC.27
MDVAQVTCQSQGHFLAGSASVWNHTPTLLCTIERGLSRRGRRKCSRCKNPDSEHCIPRFAQQLDTPAYCAVATPPSYSYFF